MSGATMVGDIGRWVHQLQLDDIPPEVVGQARRALLDAIGVITAGIRHPASVKLRRAFASGTGPASIVGGGAGSPEAAALINAAAAHAYDFDDVYCGIMHGSAVIAPAVLAAMETVDAGDSRALEALVAGSEVTMALVDALTAQHYFRGWWPTATLPVIGASAAVAKIHGMSAEQIGHAVGLAAAHAGGTRSVFGTDGKPFLCGFAARTAVEFAAAAGAGITGPVDAFENRSGFPAVLNDDVFDPAAFNTLGTEWRLVEPGITFKQYPICSSAQALTEECAALRETHLFNPADVENVHCRVPELVARSLVYDQPETAQQCQFSIPFGAACGLHYGGVGLAHITAGANLDDELRSTMTKVSWAEEVQSCDGPAEDRLSESARITVRLNSGSQVEGYRRVATGVPAVPLSSELLAAKFRSCLDFADIPEVLADEAIETVMDSTARSGGDVFARLLSRLWAASPQI